MVSIEDAVTARYETGGNRFEILIDSELAQDYKEGEEIDWEDAIAVDGIWSDNAKGEPVSYTHLTLPTILRV